MISIREEILASLKSRPGGTSAELARSLNVTQADIRHHLRKLLNDGLVEIAGERPSRRRGRPSRAYILTQRRGGLAALAGNLLDQLLHDTAPEQREQLLQQLARRMAGPAPDQDARLPHITQRLLGAVQHLNQYGYQARWEARPAAPMIVLGQCPYASVIENHPELCQFDLALLHQLTGETLHQVEKRMPNPQGVPVCIFAAGKR